MKNQLVPTPIVDSLGRQTTVHKRADNGTSSATQASKIPGPAASQPDAAQRYVNDHFVSCVDTVPAADRPKLMATLHPDTLPRMDEMKREHPNMVLLNVNNALDWCTQNLNFSVFNSLVMLIHETQNRESEWHGDALHALMGIRYTIGEAIGGDGWNMEASDEDRWIDFTDPDDPRVAGARALHAVIMDEKNNDLTALQSLQYYQCAKTFDDTAVGNYIMCHPTRAQEIVDIYRDRGIFDSDLFDTVLNNPSPALNEGVL